jgi:hypothetical protein
MKEAPALVLFALFDSIAQIHGAQLALFESEHPEAPAAFRAWCEERGHVFTELTTGRGEVALVVGTDQFHIFIHTESNRKVA